jgi:hypothetical protein
MSEMVEKGHGMCQTLGCGTWHSLPEGFVGLSPVDGRVTFHCSKEHAEQSSEVSE